MRTLILLILCFASLGAAPATRPADLHSRTQQLLSTWKPRLDAEGFSYTSAPPFLIAGDMPQSQLHTWRDRTIQPATLALRDAYFKTEPTEPVLILLFSNEKTYREHAQKWFGDTDVSYYGYFRSNRVMLMNIATGGGTLVHEMVHALLRPDFPDCPDWVNEGLGSLYEQCQLSPLKGLPNWRLSALQEAIRKDQLRPLSSLILDDDFYAKAHVGQNYAQARYLLFYLQEKGLLQRFYRDLRENHQDDPTGLATLKSLIAPQKLADLEKDWRQWVLGLSFP